MMKLESLSNSSRGRKRRKEVGRGVGSGSGKTCGRGTKGMGARSGYKVRAGYIGGAGPLHKRVPSRGFSQVRFQKLPHVFNLSMIEKFYEDGEVVNMETLRERGLIKGVSHGVKILANGHLTKKISFQVDELSQGAKDKLQQAGIKF